MVDFRLIPGDPDFPTSNKRDLLPKDHWLRTERYIDADRSPLGRHKENVQDAIFAFSQAGGKFPASFDWENPEHYFIQGTQRIRTQEATGGGWRTSAKEKHQGWLEVPVVWSTNALWSAVSAYTDIHHEKGAGKKYDYFFSFFIKGLEPEWPCILTICTPRGRFPTSKENPRYSYELRLLGLSPWEKFIKEKERELFRATSTRDMAELRFVLDRLLFMDSELEGVMHQMACGWDPMDYGDLKGWQLVEKFYPEKAFREKLVRAWNSIDDQDERYGRSRGTWSDFEILLRDSYRDLMHLVETGVLDELTTWKEADDLLQKALCNEPYPQSGPINSLVMNIPSCRSLLHVLTEFWAGADIARVSRLAHNLRFTRR